MRRRTILVLAALAAGCHADGGAGGAPASGGAGGTASGGAISSGAGGAGAGGVATGDGGAGGTDLGRPPGGMGGPACGLAAAAFCETFDAPTTTRGRGGDLDPRRWSAGRGAPQLPTGNGVVFGIGPATVPTCRPGVMTEVYPDDDSLICTPTADIASSHLLVAVGAQNYGQNSYRIRQPFDFAGRTGKIVFDAEGFLINPLLGWISLEVTEDPTPIPSFSIGNMGTTNFEGGSVPRNALEIHFSSQCAGYERTPHVAVSLVDVLTAYQDHVVMPDPPKCVATAAGKLNHFEVTISQQKVEVYGTAFSADGTHFEAPTLMWSGEVALPFSRGYVHITTHNHASLKYSHNGDYGTTHSYDAWIARWDNVGFDGPIVGHLREHEIPDALTPGMNAWNRSGPVLSVGYTVPDAAKGTRSLVFHDVHPDDVAAARVAVGAWYDLSAVTKQSYLLKYRMNGHGWHDRPFTAAELGVLTNSHAQGAIGQMLDVPVDELVAGDNTLELAAVNVPQGYPPAVANVDLVLTTK